MQFNSREFGSQGNEMSQRYSRQAAFHKALAILSAKQTLDPAPTCRADPACLGNVTLRNYSSTHPFSSLLSATSPQSNSRGIDTSVRYDTIKPQNDHNTITVPTSLRAHSITSFSREQDSCMLYHQTNRQKNGERKEEIKERNDKQLCYVLFSQPRRVALDEKRTHCLD